MRKIVRAASVGVLVCAAPLAHAVPTAGWTTTDTHVYGRLVNFDAVGALPANTVVSNQFQSQGLRFSGSVRANGCPYNSWTAYGMTNNTLGSFGPGCTTNQVSDAFSLRFDQTVSKLALDAYLLDNKQIATLDLYLKGSLVSSFSMPALSYTGLALNASVMKDGRSFANGAVDRSGILQVEGTLFDEIRFSENWAQGHYGYLFFDNLRFDSVAAGVPEPASLGLLALGLAGIGAMRRRRATPA